MDQTFIFVDLAGFTALTELHGDEHAADLAEQFFADVREILDEHSAREVKTIGDAIMIRCESAAAGIGLALRVVQDVGTRHGFPSVRAGLNTGPAVERHGDWFGAAVNLAARVSALAAGGQVLLTGASAAAAGAPGGGDLGAVHPHGSLMLEPRGRRELRNVVEPVELFEASCERSRSAEGLPIDPVCRMAVDPEQEAGTIRHGADTFHFCSRKCFQTFLEDPERYAEAMV